MNKTKISYPDKHKTDPWYGKTILHIGALILLSGIFLVPYIGSQYPLHDWDESRHAINALEMVNSGNWITVTYNHEPDMANIKFPLGAWLIAINYKLFGVNEFSIRLWSVIFTILTTVLVYLFGTLIRNKWTGILAALIFISSTQVIGDHAGITGDYDAGASFFLALSLFLFLLFYQRKKDIFFILSMISVGLGVMYKSFIPGLIPLVIIVFFLMLSRERKSIDLKNILLFALFIIVIIISPWLIVRSISDGSFVLKLLEFDYWQRLTSPVDSHAGSLWFYVAEMQGGFYPWIYFLPLGLFLALRGYIKNKNEDYLFLLVSSVTIFSIFSIATTKNFWYILPFYPVAAILVALFWATLLGTALRLRYGIVLSVVLSLFLALNIVSAILNARYALYIPEVGNKLPFVIAQESIKKELLSSDVIVYADSVTQSNLFYLERLLGDNFTISPVATCDLDSRQVWLVCTGKSSLRAYLEKCPERRTINSSLGDRYRGGCYSLIK